MACFQLITGIFEGARALCDLLVTYVGRELSKSVGAATRLRMGETRRMVSGHDINMSADGKPAAPGIHKSHDEAGIVGTASYWMVPAAGRGAVARGARPNMSPVSTSIGCPCLR